MLQKKNIVLASAVLAASFCIGNVFAAEADEKESKASKWNPGAVWINGSPAQTQATYVEALEDTNPTLSFASKAQAITFIKKMKLSANYTVKPLYKGCWGVTDSNGGALSSTTLPLTAANLNVFTEFQATLLFSAPEDATKFAKTVNLKDYVVTSLGDKKKRRWYLSDKSGAMFKFTDQGFVPATASSHL